MSEKLSRNPGKGQAAAHAARSSLERLWAAFGGLSLRACHEGWVLEDSEDETDAAHDVCTESLSLARTPTSDIVDDAGPHMIASPVDFPRGPRGPVDLIPRGHVLECCWPKHSAQRIKPSCLRHFSFCNPIRRNSTRRLVETRVHLRP